MQDRNFDDLVDRFSKKIYQSLKGQIRLGVIRRDLRELVPELWQRETCRVLDAGGGLGMFTMELAELGHDITYCDISSNMVAAAKESAHQQSLDNITFIKEPVQSLLQRDADFQVVLFHAVLEWLADPKAVLDQMIATMNPGAKLSLLFYNQQSIVYRNLLRGNFYKATAEDQQGDKGSLTPSHPLNPGDVKRWVSSHNAKILSESGVRVFYDYGEKQRLAQRTPEQIINAELTFSQQEPYRSLGRYYHLIIEKRLNTNV